MQIHTALIIKFRIIKLIYIVFKYLFLKTNNYIIYHKKNRFQKNNYKLLHG
jgi:hypothetical protein